MRLLRCAAKILFIITKQRMSKVNKTRKRAQVDTIRWEPPAGQVVVVGEGLGSRSERKTRTKKRRRRRKRRGKTQKTKRETEVEQQGWQTGNQSWS